MGILLAHLAVQSFLIAIYRSQCRRPGALDRPSSLFTVAAHLYSVVWLPRWVERVIAPRRRCSAAATSFLTTRYLSAFTGTTYAPPPTVLHGTDCCLEMVCTECAAVSGLEATPFRRVRTRTRIPGHLCRTSSATTTSAFPSPTLSPQFETSPYPRIRPGMDGNRQDWKWLRGRNLPSIQDAAPRYGRPLPTCMDVPGAGLFVALGTSTA
ncbi:hypothetical protein BD311DRAFT_777079 [Dichomitus squalens]|uniref:Uncharacterized protein n=1 Tax=Dichomitus squalens TaxID=114155 RepID=A0A4Q9MS65_9APHY|nr:hypothetical protein BD311DRAFT_777079 [Dichomitus squalens]